MTTVALEIKIRNKEKLLAGIDNLATARDSTHYDWLKEALAEATLFFYDSISEVTAFKMIDVFLKKADANTLAASINKLWTGTPKRKSTDYHKALGWVLSDYIVEKGYGEFVHGPEKPEESVAKEWQEIFTLARDARETAPARTAARISYPGTISDKPQ